MTKLVNLRHVWNGRVSYARLAQLVQNDFRIPFRMRDTEVKIGNLIASLRERECFTGAVLSEPTRNQPRGIAEISGQTRQIVLCKQICGRRPDIGCTLRAA